MKRILLILPIVALLMVSCNNCCKKATPAKSDTVLVAPAETTASDTAVVVK